MAETDRTDGYGAVAIFLHWSVAILILSNLAVGWIGEEMGRGPAKAALFQWHMSLGILVLLLSALRLAWRWIEPPPEPLARVAWERKLAKAVHAALLAVALAGPTTGVAAQLAEGRPIVFLGLELAAAAPGGSPAALAAAPALADEARDDERSGRDAAAGREEDEEIWQGMHALLVKPVLILLLLLHVGGALKHHLVDGDDTLRRIVGRTGRVTTGTEPAA